MTTDTDVIIAGAGPAGSLAAYKLAVLGAPVLILEKSPFPRYKVCGAGLTHKILRELPFDVLPVLETQIHNIIFSCGFREVFTRTSAEPMMYCTTREKLDDFLLKAAIEVGARVIHGAKVMEVTQEKEFVTVVTPVGTFRSKLVIGADGAASAVARSAGLRDNILPQLAWQAEVRADPATVKTFSQTVFLDWGCFPSGYGWVFPKGDHFSIGVSGAVSLSKWTMSYYQKLLEYLDVGCGKRDTISGRGDAGSVHPAYGIRVREIISLKSWTIPVRIIRSRYHNGRVLVAGDAAGLADPFTGEGIYYAVRSGMLAATCCHEYLQAGSPSLEPYTKAVNDELMEELLEANRIKFLFNTVPLQIHRFVRDSDRAWRAFLKILRGERLYADVPGGFGRWQVLWGAACLVSKWISFFKERRFAKKGFT